MHQSESVLSENQKETKGFIINLQESKNSIDDDLKAQENVIKNDNIKVSKKASIFSKLFGRNTKAEKKIEESKVNFFDEIREISENNEIKHTKTSNNTLSETSLSENNVSQLQDSESNFDKGKDEVEVKNDEEKSNEINDDLLQIPAFLRRQAN